MKFRTALAVLGFSMVASASTITFDTVSGVDTAGNPVNASAVVTTANGGLVTVTLNNLQSGIFEAGQLLSDFFFTLSAAPSAINTSVVPTGSLIDIAPGGAVTTDNGTIDGWVLTSSGATLHLDSLAVSGPSQTIIGPGPFTTANASITGSTHNPYLNQTASFSFTVAGVTSATTVSNGIFSFGTQAGDNVTGCVAGGPSCQSSTVPEPVTSALVGSGLIALFFVRRRVRG